MTKIGSNLQAGQDMLKQLQDMRRDTKFEMQAPAKTEGKASFLDHLKNALDETNQAQIAADKKATDLANGKDTNIHETMLAASQAELSFNMMVQVRNKALQAYQEIMRMPV